MVKSVSSSSDASSESIPVPVADLGGHYEEHRADPVDLSAARASSAVNFQGLKNIQTNDWIENLMDGPTLFTGAKGSFKLTAAGYHGSIQPISEDIRQDPYLLRAVQRGKIAFLSEDGAMEKITTLVDESDGSDTHLDRLRESLNAGASDNNGMYKIDLPDEAEPKGKSQSWEQVWNNSTSNPKPKPTK